MFSRQWRDQRALGSVCETCSEGRPPQQLTDTKCSQEDTLEVVKKQCDGRKVCVLNATAIRASDPCPGISKYQDTTHRTLCPNRSKTPSASVTKRARGSWLKGEGKVIFVYTAVYGRSDRTTCASGRPESQIQDVRCSRFSSKVAESCDGKNSCVISASNAAFGDPCVGTYKYLTVSYTCHGE
ncbi:L-rhamnose-binding lectin CSL2-like [Chaetodon trifascialis]|uniref:L-rhamnose-binding lectin CSL2-like n=1 Tax=Chaetodon trifascialis TaxID=109706 RepID=UPI003991BEFC